MTEFKYLTPTYRSADLVCLDAPRGQLPATSSNGQVAERIIGIDEAGEDCRQKLARVKMKTEVFEEVVAQINAGKDPTKIDPKKD